MACDGPRPRPVRIARAIYLRAEGPLQLLPELALLAFFGVVLMTVAFRAVEARS